MAKNVDGYVLLASGRLFVEFVQFVAKNIHGYGLLAVGYRVINWCNLELKTAFASFVFFAVSVFRGSALTQRRREPKDEG